MFFHVLSVQLYNDLSKDTITDSGEEDTLPHVLVKKKDQTDKELTINLDLICFLIIYKFKFYFTIFLNPNYILPAFSVYNPMIKCGGTISTLPPPH